MLRLQARGVCAHLHLQHFQLVRAQLGKGLLPAFTVIQCGQNLLGFKGKFVVQKFVEKNLRDDFELVAIIAQPISGTNSLEAINELSGAFFKILRNQMRAPVLLVVSYC